MKQIKVAHIANIDVGLKNHLGNYMRYQRDQGYAVSAVTHPGRWLTHDTTILDGIAVKIIPFEPRLSPGPDLKTLVELVRYFRRERFDIVHTHAVKPGLLGRLAARIAGIPVIVHTVHGFYFYEGSSWSERRIFQLVERVGAASCDLILSQNRQDIETAIQQRICAPDKIRHLGNGIDLRRFSPARVSDAEIAALRRALDIPERCPVIAFVGRWVRDKGVQEFVQATSILRARGIEARYLIVGAAQPEKNTNLAPDELIHSLGLDEQFILLGYRDDIPQLLSLADMVVLPSYGREGIPRVLMESAAMAKPAVATQVRGNVEAVHDGVTGVLVPARDARALAEAIGGLLAAPERAREMGRQARALALERFDEREFFRRTDVEYRRLLRAKQGIDPEAFLKPVPDLGVTDGVAEDRPVALQETEA